MVFLSFLVTSLLPLVNLLEIFLLLVLIFSVAWRFLLVGGVMLNYLFKYTPTAPKHGGFAAIYILLYGHDFMGMWACGMGRC